MNLPIRSCVLLLAMAMGTKAIAMQPATHCRTGEPVAMSCQLSNKKTISLCGAVNTLQYRYGRTRNPLELSYPQKGDFTRTQDWLAVYIVPSLETELRSFSGRSRPLQGSPTNRIVLAAFKPFEEEPWKSIEVELLVRPGNAVLDAGLRVTDASLGVERTVVRHRCRTNGVVGNLEIFELLKR